jgi:hypothetical protein
MAMLTSVHLDSWLATYKRDNAALLERDPEFARWLQDEYVPIAGGWQY